MSMLNQRLESRRLSLDFQATHTACDVAILKGCAICCRALTDIVNEESSEYSKTTMLKNIQIMQKPATI